MNAQIVNLLPVVLIFIIFYFLLIKPQKKAQVDHKKMVDSLKKNDEIITSGGIHGVIANVKETTIILKVDDNVKIEVQKSSVTSVKSKAKE